MKKNTITYIIIAFLVIFGGYWAYGKFSSGGAETPATSAIVVTTPGQLGSVVKDEATDKANQFIQVLDNVKQVDLANLSLLSNPLFKDKLQDFGKPLEDRPIGRANPFAPVSGISVTTKKAAATNTPAPAPVAAKPAAVEPVVQNITQSLTEPFVDSNPAGSFTE